MEIRPDARQEELDLIDIAEEARAAAQDALRHLPHVRIDTSGAAPAPFALGDRRRVWEQLSRLIAEVFAQAAHAIHGGPTSGVTRLSVRASLSDDASIAVRVEAGDVWRELRLPVACTAALDAPALAQIERYGFLRLAAN